MTKQSLHEKRGAPFLSLELHLKNLIARHDRPTPAGIYFGRWATGLLGRPPAVTLGVANICLGTDRGTVHIRSWAAVIGIFQRREGVRHRRRVVEDA